MTLGMTVRNGHTHDNLQFPSSEDVTAASGWTKWKERLSCELCEVHKASHSRPRSKVARPPVLSPVRALRRSGAPCTPASVNTAARPLTENVVIKSWKSKPSHVKDDTRTVWRPRVRKKSVFTCMQSKRPSERPGGQDMKLNNTCAPAAFDVLRNSRRLHSRRPAAAMIACPQRE